MYGLSQMWFLFKFIAASVYMISTIGTSYDLYDSFELLNVMSCNYVPLERESVRRRAQVSPIPNEILEGLVRE